MDLKDRGARGVTSALLLRHADGGTVVIDGHTSIGPTSYETDERGRRALLDSSATMRLQMHVALANRLNRALVECAGTDAV